MASASLQYSFRRRRHGSGRRRDDRDSRAVAGSALGWREWMGRGSLGVRWSAARLLPTKRELSRFADGLRSKVREAHADESDASLWREDRPYQVERDFA